MIVLAVHLDQMRLVIGADLGEDVAQPVDGIVVEPSAAVLRHKDQVDVHLKNTVPIVLLAAHRVAQQLGNGLAG